jgi:uncharacterized protein YegL
MESTREDVIGGFNAFVTEQQSQPGECRLTMLQFDSQGTDFLYVAVPIAQVVPMRRQDFVPRGGTPLFDAIAQAITLTDTRVKTITDPEVQLFVIITDGDENSSRKYTDKTQIAVMIEERQGKGWVFTFLGANLNAYAAGRDIGIAAQNVSSFAADSGGTAAAYASVSSNTAAMRSAVSKGVTGQVVNAGGFYSFTGKGAETYMQSGPSTNTVHPDLDPDDAAAPQDTDQVGAEPPA